MWRRKLAGAHRGSPRRAPPDFGESSWKPVGRPPPPPSICGASGKDSPPTALAGPRPLDAAALGVRGVTAQSRGPGQGQQVPEPSAERDSSFVRRGVLGVPTSQRRPPADKRWLWGSVKSRQAPWQPGGVPHEEPQNWHQGLPRALVCTGPGSHMHVDLRVTGRPRGGTPVVGGSITCEQVGRGAARTDDSPERNWHNARRS